jgi:hypothetical protein
METTTTPTAVREVRTLRTGREVATIVLTFPDGTTYSLGGKRAARANAVIVSEAARYDYSQRDPDDDRRMLRTGWGWGDCGTRISVADAHAEADRLKRVSPDHFRQCFVILVAEG